MALPDCFDCKYGGLEHPCRKPDGSYDFDKAAAALVVRGREIRAERSIADAQGEPGDWITDCEYELVADHPDLIMPLIIAAIDACETPADAGFVAAGLIENALVKHGQRLIGDIERLAKLSPKVPYILSGVWSQSGAVSATVWTRLGQAIGASGRMSDDPREAHDGSAITILTDGEAIKLLAEKLGPTLAATKPR